MSSLQDHDEKVSKVEPLFKISRLGCVHGEGIIATGDIKAGELILKEEPIVFDQSEEGIRNAFNLMKKKHSKWLNMLPYYQQQVSSNASQFEIFQAQVARCAFRRQDSDILTTYAQYALYLNMSKINHSCLPNASKSLACVNVPCGLYALKNICKGEEITIYYHFDNSMFLPTNQRRDIIKLHYFFDCKCVRCMYSIDTKKLNLNYVTKDDIKKGILFEKMLKGAIYPNNLKNKSKSKRSKYALKMKQEFDNVENVFSQTKTKLNSPFGYDFDPMINDLQTLINLINTFLNKYGNNKFLLSTHWRNIQLIKKYDIVFRWYVGLIKKAEKRNTFVDFPDALKQLLPESYFGVAIDHILDLLQSYHELLINHLEYDYFGAMQCANVTRIDSWIDYWQHVYYPQETNAYSHDSKDNINTIDDIKEDDLKNIIEEIRKNGVAENDKLTQRKNCLLLLAHTIGTPMYYCVESFKTLSVNKQLIYDRLEFTCKKNF